MRLYSQGSAGKLLESTFEEGEPLEHRWLNPMIERAQKTVEQHHYSIRKRLLQYDDVGSKQREVIYALRNEAISSDTPKSLIFELIEEELDVRAEEFGILVAKKGENEKEVKDFHNWLMQSFPVRLKLDTLKESEGAGIIKMAIESIREAYQLKEEAEDPESLRIAFGSLSAWCSSATSTSITRTTSPRWRTCGRASASAATGRRIRWWSTRTRPLSTLMK